MSITPQGHPPALIMGRTDGAIFVPVLVDDAGVVQTSGGVTGIGVVTLADGADTTEGTIADAKVVGDNAGTVSAKLRGINYLLALATDTLNGWFRVSIENTSVPVAPAPATSATLSNVSASATVVTLLAATTRSGGIFFNDSASSAYLKFGAGASLTSFTYKIFPYQTAELPSPVYQGQITALWDSAVGTMRITEVV